jgi:hypothetical protein
MYPNPHLLQSRKQELLLLLLLQLSTATLFPAVAPNA